MTKPLLILIVLLSIALARCAIHEPSLKDTQGPPRMSETVEKAPMVLWCDLVRNPERYNKLAVRTHALLHLDHENEFLYEPECDSERFTPTWVVFDPSYVYSDEKIKLRLVELIKPSSTGASGTARVVVVGRFEADGGPYGHLNGYPSQFSIIRLEEAEPPPTISGNR